ncbi:NAD(P)-binding protein [Setomelanomma holmii]|uniref:NAD(P)-binding protein n=1 Tax=Setomelanomma holmii TaxID=210430 RepID=A0A9P4LRM9_9PLEO|nr:NAD(P)-binding protein [Setomelanomma holmii]
MPSAKTFLVTGASRGIGKGLVSIYLSNPNTTVIATVRDPLHPTSQSLLDVPKAAGSNLIVLQIADTASVDAIKSAIASLPTGHGIATLDNRFIDVNAFGTLELLKAVPPLLRSSETPGKFVYISSAGGSLTSMNNVLPLSAYGASKALGKFLIKWLSLENEDVMVAREMGAMGFIGLLEQEIDVMEHVMSVEKSVAMMIVIIDNATKQSVHSKFLGHDAADIPW